MSLGRIANDNFVLSRSFKAYCNARLPASSRPIYAERLRFVCSASMRVACAYCSLLWRACVIPLLPSLRKMSSSNVRPHTRLKPSTSSFQIIEMASTQAEQHDVPETQSATAQKRKRFIPLGSSSLHVCRRQGSGIDKDRK